MDVWGKAQKTLGQMFQAKGQANIKSIRREGIVTKAVWPKRVKRIRTEK